MSVNHLAEKKLAGLIALELDIVVSDQTLGFFIRDNWARIAPLAHLIHGQPDLTKAEMNAAAPTTPSRPAPEERMKQAAAKLRQLAHGQWINGLSLMASDLDAIAKELE